MKKQMAKIKLPDGTFVEGEVVETFEKQAFNDPWEPLYNQSYCSIDHCFVSQCSQRGILYGTNIGKISKKRIEIGNCFETGEIAKHEAKRESLLRRMRNFARANGGGGSWEIAINKQTKKLLAVTTCSTVTFWPGTFATKEVAEEAIRRYGDEIKALYEEEV